MHQLKDFLAQKKGAKQVIDNYRPVSLLPIFAKFLKDLFLIHYLNFFMKTIYLMRTNQDSDHLIHVKISSYQLYMIHVLVWLCQRLQTMDTGHYIFYENIILGIVYHQLTTLKKKERENVTDFIIWYCTKSSQWNCQ